MHHQQASPSGKSGTSLLILIFAFTISLSGFAQQIISVNQFTGEVQASIPLHTVKANSLSVPIMLGYSSNGMPIDQATGQAGIGWYISTGGQISRSVKDIPDDFQDESSSYSIYGWLHNGAASDVGDFVDAHSNASDCDHTIYDDLEEFGGHNGTDDIYDLEPDIFRLSVPGHLSATFTFDETGEFVFLQNRELDITPAYDSAGLITSFTVLSDEGISYTFEENLSVEESMDYDPGESSIVDFHRTYYSIKDTISYVQSWTLHHIKSPTGERIDFLYGPDNPIYLESGSAEATTSTESDTLWSYYYNDYTESYLPLDLSSTRRSYTFEGHLRAIETEWETVAFEQNGVVLPIGYYKFEYPIITDLKVLDRQTNEKYKAYKFTYNPVRAEGELYNYSHLYLSHLVAERGGKRLRYSFLYEGINYGSGVFVKRESPERDPFGFYSPRSAAATIRQYSLLKDQSIMDQVRFYQLAGLSESVITTPGFTSDRPSVARVASGSLNKVYLPYGGYEQVYYELNKYYDSLSNQDQYGGGVRVKKLRIHDGVSYSSDKEIHFDYADSAGHSSGVRMYKPTLFKRHPFRIYKNPGIERTYYPDLVSSGLPEDSIFMQTFTFTKNDLTQDESPGYNIGYRQCTVTQEGSGSTITYFDIDKNLEDSYSGFLDGMITVPDLSSAEDCLTGLTTSDHMPLNFGFNYRFNGLVDKVVSYNEEGNKVSSTHNSYEIIGALQEVYGIKAYSTKLKTSSTGVVDGFRFGIYQLDFGIDKVLSQSITRTYDPSTDTSYMTSSVEYQYSDDGRIMVRQEVDPEGNVYATRNIYPDQYSIGTAFASQSPSVQAISKFQEKGWNTLPVESRRTLEVGGTEKTIGASLTTWFYDSISDHIYPASTYQLRIGEPIADFDTLEVNESSTAELDMDPRYIELNRIVSSNQFGNPTSMRGRGDQRTFVHYVQNGRYVGATITGALESEVVFDDFSTEGTYPAPFPQPIGGGSLQNGRIIGQGYPLSVEKRVYSVTSTDPDYTLSFWARAASSGTIFCQVRQDGSLVAADTIAVAGDDSWNYYHAPFSVPEDSLELIISSSDVLTIDEIAFYPSKAALSHTHYGSGGWKLAETNNNGRTTYYEYDDIGELQAIRDHDGHLLQSFESSTRNDIFQAIGSQGDSTYLTYDGIAKDGVEIRFYTDDFEECYPFKWSIVPVGSSFDFDNPDATTSTPELNHTFSTEYDTTYKVSFQTVCDSETIQSNVLTVVVQPSPLVVDFCYDRPNLIDLCNTDTENYVSGCSTSRQNGKVQFEVTTEGGSENYAIRWYRKGIRSRGADGSIIAPELMGTGVTIAIDNYYEKYIYFEVEDLETGHIERGPDVFFETYSSSTCEN